MFEFRNTKCCHHIVEAKHKQKRKLVYRTQYFTTTASVLREHAHNYPARARVMTVHCTCNEGSMYIARVMRVHCTCNEGTLHV